MTHVGNRPITRNLEIEALEQAVRWPDAQPQTVALLAGQYLATRRDQDGFDYFHERAQAQPREALFLALEGLFEARLAARAALVRRLFTVNDALGKLDRAVAQEPGLTTYFRGLVLADLPAMLGKAEAAVTDLEWVLANKEQFPVGLRRGAYRSLAKALGTLGRHEAAREALQRSGHDSVDRDDPLFVTDFSLSSADGARLVPPRLIEPAPGVFVAQGYDFSDLAFVLTDDGVVAIDASNTEAHARAALDDLHRHTDLPVRHVILTHAHWDHVGGLNAFVPDGPGQPGAGPSGVQVIAQAGFADELRIVNQTGVPFRAFFGGQAKRHFDVAPDHLVSEREQLTIGGVEFDLYPVHGGETHDALLIHLPASGVLFVGDVLMPQLGAPFMPEGSAEELFATLELIRYLEPRLLIHGHTPLTDLFTIEALPGIEAAVRDLYEHVLAGIEHGMTLVQILHQNYLPDVLRSQPSAVVPFLVMRDNVVSRVYHQRTGYWKPDGEGVEPLAPAEWAAAVDLLGGGKEGAFVKAVETLLAQSDDTLALKLVDLGLLSHPTSQALVHLRRRALDGLRARYQQLHPFKFIVYSEWAGAELPAAA